MSGLIDAFAASASADRALLNLQRWLECLPDPDIFYRQVADRRALDLLVTLFAGSQFLTSYFCVAQPTSRCSSTAPAWAGRRVQPASTEAHECVAPYLESGERQVHAHSTACASSSASSCASAWATWAVCSICPR